MLSGEKILVTGAGGAVATPIAQYLAQENEVWGVSRFGDPERRATIEASGIKAVSIDLADDDLTDLPANFTYVVHMAWIRCAPTEFDRAARVNAEAAGRVIQHCRNAKAVLVASSTGVYSPKPDPWHRFPENSYLGRGCSDDFLEANKIVRMANPTSSPAKIATEAVARFAAKSFGVPLTLGRLNTVIGPHKALHGRQIREVLAGETIAFPHDPNPHTPVHVDDMSRQIESLLDAATVAGTVVNWCGDDVVTGQEWVRLAAELAGVQAKLSVVPLEGYARGNISDNARRLSITGPCETSFWDGFRRLFNEITGIPATQLP